MTDSPPPPADAPNTPGNKRLSVRRLAGLAFAAATLFFLGAFVVRNIGELRDHEWTIRPGLLLLSVLLNILVLVGGVGIWQVLVRRTGVKIGLMPLARVWFLSSLGRYIPGKIWQFISAAHVGSGARVPPAVTVATLAAHSGYFFVGAILTAAYFIPPEIMRLGGIPPSVAHWTAPAVLLLAHPAVITWGLALVRKAGAPGLEHWSPRWSDGLLVVALSVASWVFSGLALYLFVISITAAPDLPPGAVIGFNAMTFIIGNAVFFTPAGLGAKEGTLTVLLAIFLSAPVAAVIAVAARLWTVAAEVLPALLLVRGPHVATASEVADDNPIAGGS